MRERERTCYSHLRTKKCLVIFSYTIIKTLWNRHLETTFVKMHQVLTWAHRITKTFLHSFILSLSVCLFYFGQRCSHKSLPLTFPREAPWISGIAERGKTDTSHLSWELYPIWWKQNLGEVDHDGGSRLVTSTDDRYRDFCRPLCRNRTETQNNEDDTLTGSASSFILQAPCLTQFSHFSLKS